MRQCDLFHTICSCVAALYAGMTDEELDEIEVVIRGHQLQLEKART